MRGTESVWVELIIKNKRILYGTFYRPPNSSPETWDLLEHSVDLAYNTGIDDIIITGDLNEDQLNPNNIRIKNIIMKYGFEQLIEEPTHYTETNSSLLDIIISSGNNIVKKAYVSEHFLPAITRYHCPIVGLLNVQKPILKTFKRQIWLFNQGDYNTYRESLANVDWDSVIAVNGDINQLTTAFTTLLTEKAKQSIPNKLVTIRKSDPPWINNKIRRLIRKRKRVHRKAKSTNLPNHWANFRKIRNSVIAEIRKVKLQYESKIIDEINNGDPQTQTWWKKISDFAGFQKKKQNIPTLVSNDDNIFTDDEEKASCLNDYFISQTLIDDYDKPLPPQQIMTDAVLENIQITPADVSDVLKSLNVSKSCGPDSVNPRILREASDEICEPLSKIFNISLSTHTFPNAWKLANIVPVFKKNDPSSVKNYRPISLLSIIGKIMERCIYKYLNNYLLDNNILTEHQSGFRPKDSTVNQLVFLCNEINKAVDIGKEIRIVFCDISKAFDRVWHNGLIHKLKNIGIQGDVLLWFKSYLQNRQQRVVINNLQSEWANIKAGVPQGSILGPLLFLIYINDIVLNIDINIKLFADDTTLYVTVENKLDQAEDLNRNLRYINTWAQTWLVDFNPSKTVQMIITKKANQNDHPPIYMNNIEIQKVQSHKHLGVILNEKTNWNEHIREIKSKAYKRINLMRKLKFKLNRKVLTTIYLTFIRPTLEYADIVWQNIPLYLQDELEQIQLEAARIITGAIKLTSRELLYKETGLVTLSERRRHHRLILFHKMVNKRAPQYLNSLVPPKVSHTYYTRNNLNLQEINCRTSHYQNSFLPKTVHDWNLLSAETKSIESESSFKNKIAPNQVTVPAFYMIGSRGGQILMARLRMNNCGLNDHLYRYGLVDTPYCACGSRENTRHFLLYCPLFNQIRNETIGSLQNQYKTLNTLLFGNLNYPFQINEHIFLTVQKYLLKSNRFNIKN